MPGVFWVAIDGVDGVGKSTQVSKLNDWAKMEGRQSMILDEWSCSPLGVLCKELVSAQRFFSLHPSKVTPFADSCALIADLLYKREMVSRSASGPNTQLVISDRGLLSLVAYQAQRIVRYGGMSLDSATNYMVSVVKAALGVLGGPDIHVVIRLAEDEIQKRVVGRGEPPLSEADLQFLIEVQDLMCGLGSLHPTRIIEGTGVSADDMTGRIIDEIFDSKLV